MNNPLLRVTPTLASVVAMALSSACAEKKSCDYENPRCRGDRVCAFVQRDDSRCVPYAVLERELLPPFREGHPFYCSQGGRSAVGRTHAFAGDVFALDLNSTSLEPYVEIVSPVAGTAYVFDECEERDPSASAFNNSRCGLGYGNHVKVWDGENIYLLAHLARASVKPGPVERGAVLGLMGVSGAAGDRHVHLSVTRPDRGSDVEAILRTPGWTGQVPVRYRLAAENTETKEPVREWPDELSCTHEESLRTVLVR